MKLSTAFAATILVLTASGCNQGRLTTGENVSLSMAQLLDTVVGTLGLALNDPERETTIARHAPRQGADRLWELYLSPWPRAEAAACSATRFSPALGGSSCGANPADKTVTIAYGSCSAGPSPQATLSGTATFVFSDKTACDTWLGGNTVTSGSAAWTSLDFLRTDFDRGATTTSSASEPNYLGQSVGGGIVTTFSAANRSVAVTGLRRTHAGGELGAFDHSIRTTSPLIVTGSKLGGTRAVASGTFVLDDNGDQFSVSITAASLTWSASCCYPTAGSLAFTLTGKLTGTASANFNTGTCGRVSITNTFGQAATIGLQACE